VPINFFSFLTIPSLFHFFTSSESSESGIRFISALLRFQAPKTLLGPLFQAFLFSLYAFTDALWANLHHRISARKKIDYIVAIAQLRASIIQCSPLLPPKFPRLIEDFVASAPKICKSAILKYLE
jgi:hypothetical protein